MGTAHKFHVHGVQNIVQGEVREVHMAHLRFYADGALKATVDLREVFQRAFIHDNFEMARIVDIVGTAGTYEALWWDITYWLYVCDGQGRHQSS